MTRRRGNRPSTPAEIAARKQAPALEELVDPADCHHWGLEQTLGQLTAHGDVIVSVDAARRITRARRDDIFRTLRVTRTQNGTALGPDHLLAVNRLQEDLALRMRTTGSAGIKQSVDCSTPQYAIEDLQVMAGERIDTVLACTGRTSARLLMVLLGVNEPGALLEATWRDIVTACTGVTNAAAQPGQIRMACDNLAAAYDQWDRGTISHKRLLRINF